MKDCIGIINLDENEEKLKSLINNNTISSMSIAGRYRIIDFVLSNLTNSGVECIGLFAKKKSYSLINHLSNGRPWDLHRKKYGLRIFNYSEYDPVYDDIHSFMENIDFIKNSDKEYIIMAPSYMVCNINYQDVINYHRESDNDITIVYKKDINTKNKYENCQTIEFNTEGKIEGIEVISNKSNNVNLNMEMYIMKTSLFINIVRDSLTTGLYKKINDYIISNTRKLNMGAYKFEGYLACINSIDSYFNTNKEILNLEISKELFYNRPIYTNQRDEPPTYYSKDSKVENSIIANGSYIEGKVENSIIGREVIIRNGAVIINSIVMDNCVVDKFSLINNAIVNSGVSFKEESVIEGFIEKPKII